MSEATADHGPGIPQPPATADALRDALTALYPQALPQFDRELAAAKTAARNQLSPTPMRQILGQWAERVAAERLGTARRMEELARQAEKADTREAVRPLLAELAGLQHAAGQEARRA
ncbi:hypothetical protein [Streptomyces iconiensis]|uniref:Uncharacterized protein n=1 Tax=Streptomyces iconiensis TaxID=1384038 RepID=A0ABT7A3H3_9ACTN|nr:hypothetical protein [Streptomyces iconiensis]MDJ1135416.1 hypothetical protein [Streptomyces iconiensis]